MTSNTVSLSLTADQSVQAANHFGAAYSSFVQKTMTLTVHAGEQDTSAPPHLRYPNIFDIASTYAAIRDEMLAAASSAFEFWLNEDDAVYDNF